MLSLVIPVFNEVESLAALHHEIDQVARRDGYALELLFIDDGSTDGSWPAIQALADRDARVRGIRFRRNFGKAAALNAGFRAARGTTILTLDADLQDDPAEIPHFLARLADGLDVVSGWKRVRHDPWHKVLPSRIFNGLVSRLTKVRLHDHNCGMKCYRREVIGELRLYGELHRFVPVLAAARGWRVGEIVIRHRARRHGRSKYGVNRFMKGFMDLLSVRFLTGYGNRPQHFLGTVGLACFGAGLLGLGGLTAAWVATRMFVSLEPLHLHQRALFFYSITAVILGAQFVSVGFLAELVVARNHRDTDAYAVAEETAAGERGAVTRAPA